MNSKVWLDEAEKRLKNANIGTARLDCLVLLEDEINRDRSWILAHPEYDLQIEQVEKLNTKIAQRSQHEPLAYVRGKTEFYGREFIVNRHVLEPRPESETMITLLKSLTLPTGATIIDIGTGSGALAITAKLELPTAHVIATDIDPQCLEIARQNTEKYQIDISFLQGNLLQPLRDTRYEIRDTIIIANLTYVPDNFHINQAAMREPQHAIFGGGDGLDLYRRMFTQLNEFNWQPDTILTESLPPQHPALAEIAAATGYAPVTSDDFIQVFQPKL